MIFDQVLLCTLQSSSAKKRNRKKNLKGGHGSQSEHKSQSKSELCDAVHTQKHVLKKDGHLQVECDQHQAVTDSTVDSARDSGTTTVLCTEPSESIWKDEVKEGRAQKKQLKKGWLLVHVLLFHGKWSNIFKNGSIDNYRMHCHQ